MQLTRLNTVVKTTHNRPALRLVSTKNLEREEWLNIRKKGIGSSDAAAAVGLNPYKSQLELWMEKTGRDAELPQLDPSDDTSPAFWGTLLEPIVASHYTKKTSNRVRRINAVLQHSDPELPWMLANIDREVIGANDVQILECKTAGINGSRLWKEGVPEYVQLQVMHQLAVTGKQAADVAVLLGGQHLEVYRIERDETMITQLIELERQFWNYVETDTPPPADGSASADTALRCLFPQDHGETIDFTVDEELTATYETLKQVRETISEQEKQESALKQKIQQAMGDASRAVFASGAVTWKKAKDTVTVDTKALLRDLPHLREQYEALRQGSRRFLIS